MGLISLFSHKSFTHNKVLFTPWTMKVFQGFVKFVIGYWTRPMIILVYTKEKKARLAMKFKVPNK